MNHELFNHVDFGMRLVPSILAIVLASLTRKLVGKGWLIAFLAIGVVSSIGYWLVSALMGSFQLTYFYMSKWYAVLRQLGILETYCFGIFFFSNYFVTRLKLDMNHFLFSFSGRIPRSALWIWICLSSSLGVLIGLPVYQLLTDSGSGSTGHVYLPLIIFWIIYACYIILNTWIALAVYAKRWHDCAKSGWMTLIGLVPVIGPIWLIGYLGFVRGTNGPNQYGDDSFIIQPELPGHSGIA